MRVVFLLNSSIANIVVLIEMAKESMGNLRGRYKRSGKGNSSIETLSKMTELLELEILIKVKEINV